MMTRFLTAAAALALAVSPALAAEPTSNQASNLVPRDTQSDVAPALPTPAMGADAGPSSYLRAAQQSLRDNQTGKAQQSLEMAETRLLDRSVPAKTASSADMARPIEAIDAALRDLGRNDIPSAQQHIGDALQSVS